MENYLKSLETQKESILTDCGNGLTYVSQSNYFIEGTKDYSFLRVGIRFYDRHAYFCFENLNNMTKFYIADGTRHFEIERYSRLPINQTLGIICKLCEYQTKNEINVGDLLWERPLTELIEK